MTEVNNYGLKSCPCCGEFINVVLRGDRFGNVCAYCTRCGLSTKFFENSKTAEKSASQKAKDAWNMRKRPRMGDLDKEKSPERE